jgi:hypothetical protein
MTNLRERVTAGTIGMLSGRWTMRCLIVGMSAMLICNVGSAQEFTFVLCEETGRHFSVQKERDHYLVHFHLRVKNHAGKPFFGRVRMQYPDDRQGAGVVTTLESSSVVTAGTDNDLWSLFFRVPALEAAHQPVASYQVEVGVYDALAVETHRITRSFAWRIEADGGGKERMVTERAGIPINIRVAQIEGDRIVIRYGVAGPGPQPDLTYSVVETLEVGRIPGERSLKRLN